MDRETLEVDLGDIAIGSAPQCAHRIQIEVQGAAGPSHLRAGDDQVNQLERTGRGARQHFRVPKLEFSLRVGDNA